jgi:hypothetical protein
MRSTGVEQRQAEDDDPAGEHARPAVPFGEGDALQSPKSVSSSGSARLDEVLSVGSSSTTTDVVSSAAISSGRSSTPARRFF